MSSDDIRPLWGASLATRLAGPAIARWGCEGGARRSGEWGLLRHAELSHFHRNLSNATRREGRSPFSYFLVLGWSTRQGWSGFDCRGLGGWRGEQPSISRTAAGFARGDRLGRKGLRWQMAREEEGLPFEKE